MPPSVSQFTRPWAPTGPESLAGVLLLVLSMAELLQSSHVPPGDRWLHGAVAVIACGSVGWVRVAPIGAVVAWTTSYTVDALVATPAELLGAGLAGLGVAFGVGAHGKRTQWMIAGGCFLGVWLVRDLRDPAVDTGDMLVDLGLTLLAFAAGAVVQSRTSKADELQAGIRELRANADEKARAAVALERARIARELHDIVAHAVSVIVVQAGTSGPRASRIDEDLAETLRAIETTGREALVELRRLLGVLRSTEEPDDNLPSPGLASIEDLVARVRATGLRVALNVHGEARLDAGQELTVYRVVQEGLTNALRHAPAEPVEVVITHSGAAVDVAVCNTLGAATPTAAIPGSGTGLIGLRERVTVFGGELTATRSPSHFALHATLPTQMAAAAEVQS